MLRLLRTILLTGLLLAAGGILAVNFFLRSRIAQEEFRTIVAEEVGSLLHAKVAVGTIRLGWFNKIFVDGIRIQPAEPAEASYQVAVEKIEFRFDLTQLWRRHFKLPAAITLKAPHVVLNQAGFPYEMMKTLFPLPGAGGNQVSSLDLTGGKVECLLPILERKIALNDIRGRLLRLENGVIQVRLEANAEGFLGGRIRIRGQVNPERRTHQLDIGLKSAPVLGYFSVPAVGVKAKMIWNDKEFLFRNLTTSLRGWKITSNGKWSLTSGEPVLELEAMAAQGAKTSRLRMFVDLKSQKLNAGLAALNRPEETLEGRIHRVGSKVMLAELKTGTGYEGQGEFDLSTGNVRLELEKERQKYAFKTNVTSPQGTVNFHLDHLNVSGLDVVTLGEMEWTFEEPKDFEDPLGRLKASFHTDYFILQYTPFEDFQGHFELTSRGIHEFSANWGGVFKMSGDVKWPQGRPESDMTLHVSNFDLSRVQKFAAKPLPKQLAGFLEGKLKIEGVLARPEISGNFSLKDGKIGKLDYDRGIIQFNGFVPYLALKDSKIMKGRTKLNLVGALDLSLQNMFHGVQAQTPDKYTVWKGADDGITNQEGAIEMLAGYYKIPAVAIQEGTLAGRDNQIPGKEESAHQDPYLGAGAKVQF